MQAKSQKNFSGKFGKIRGKILRTRKNMPAPTPMVLITLCIAIGLIFDHFLLIAFLFFCFSSVFRVVKIKFHTTVAPHGKIDYLHPWKSPSDAHA